jgi:arginyl-tRNA synthetase
MLRGTLSIREELAKIASDTLKGTFGADLSVEEIGSSFEVPREEKFGDLSTSIVMRLAKEKKRPPRPMAEEFLRCLEERLGRSVLKERVMSVRVEGPGFINFFYSPRQIAEILWRIRTEDENFGKPALIKSRSILLEFVSANPTGPLTVAHGRQAALGDSLAKILEFCGHKVSREYYNNDEGVQIETLGKSLNMRVEQLLKGAEEELPEGYYKGNYLIEVAKKLLDEDKKFGEYSPEERLRRCGAFAKQSILDDIKRDLSDFGVTFDNYFSQADLMKSGAVDMALRELRDGGFVYEKDGAVWFESTRFGDDKDRVLVKSDKTVTYLLPDIAYHKNKLTRKNKYDFLINILGPDHHGYITRIKAAVQALGFPKDTLEILIAQLVTLFENGKQVRMSTRAGEFVTLREILDEVGKDAGRFFFVMRKFDAHLDFDLALAKSQTPENPVFYIQYAHARIESVKKTFAERGFREIEWKEEHLSALTSASEIRIMRLLAQYGDVLAAAERTLEPYRLVPYLMELAGLFHKFYADQRVVTEDKGQTHARMMLCVSVQVVIRSGLSLLGVSAPLKM